MLTLSVLAVQNDPSLKSRKEDAVIAWTWYQFINYDVSPEWLLRLPMTKVLLLSAGSSRQIIAYICVYVCVYVCKTCVCVCVCVCMQNV